MKIWSNERGSKLLEDINNTPYSDTSESDKLDLIISAMKEVQIELFSQVAKKSRKENKIIRDKAEQSAKVDEPPSKITLTSTLIRRVDNT